MTAISDGRLKEILAGWEGVSDKFAGYDRTTVLKLMEARAVVSDLLALREAVNAVLAHRVGDLPGRGWLRDTDTSRQALAVLSSLTQEQK